MTHAIASGRVRAWIIISIRVERRYLTVFLWVEGADRQDHMCFLFMPRSRPSSLLECSLLLSLLARGIYAGPVSDVARTSRLLVTTLIKSVCFFNSILCVPHKRCKETKLHSSVHLLITSIHAWRYVNIGTWPGGERFRTPSCTPNNATGLALPLFFRETNVCTT